MWYSRSFKKKKKIELLKVSVVAHFDQELEKKAQLKPDKRSWCLQNRALTGAVPQITIEQPLSNMLQDT